MSFMIFYQARVLNKKNSSSTQLRIKILNAHKTKNLKNKYCVSLALEPSDVVFILLINAKMPTIVGILAFMSRINFMLC